MASNSGFTTTTPSNTSQVALGDDEFRQIKTFMLNWWEDEHYALGGSSSSAGEHRLGSARAYVGTLSQLSNPQPGKFFFDTDNQHLYGAVSASSWSHFIGTPTDSTNLWSAVQEFQGAATPNDVIRVYTAGDSAKNRLIINSGGNVEWGAGSGAVDTNLYRQAANLLKTDDTFDATQLRVGSGATLKSIVTADIVFPSQTIDGARSSKSTVAVSGVAEGDLVIATIHENAGSFGDDTYLGLGGAQAFNGFVGVWLSNRTTVSQSPSTTTVHIAVIDAT